MPGPSNHKRKAKQAKLQLQEARTALQDTMNLLRMAGYRVSSGSEVTVSVRRLIMENRAMKAGGAQPSVGAPQGQPQAMIPLEPVEFDLGDIDESFMEMLSGKNEPEAPSELPDPDNAIDLAAMQARVKEREAAMLQRVADKGVRYKNGNNPDTQGRQFAPHPSVAAPRTAPASASEILGKTGEDLAFDDSLPDGGRVNPQTGLSLERQRAIIALSTGKEPVPPPGGAMNPNAAG